MNVNFHKLVTPPAMINYGEIRDNGIGQVSNLYQQNKELFEQLLITKDEVIKSERESKEDYRRKYEMLRDKLSCEL